MWEPELLLKFNHILMRTHWDVATCHHTSAYVFYPSFSTPPSLQKTSKNYPDLICILILFRRTLYMPTKCGKKKLIPTSFCTLILSWESICRGKHSTCEQMPPWFVLYLYLRLEVLQAAFCHPLSVLSLLEMALVTVIAAPVLFHVREVSNMLQTATCPASLQQPNHSNHATLL